jgi:hypothetical protein
MMPELYTMPSLVTTALDATSIDNKQTKIPFDKSAKIGVIKELMEDGISDESRNEVS